MWLAAKVESFISSLARTSDGSHTWNKHNYTAHTASQSVELPPAYAVHVRRYFGQYAGCSPKRMTSNGWFQIHFTLREHSISMVQLVLACRDITVLLLAGLFVLQWNRQTISQHRGFEYCTHCYNNIVIVVEHVSSKNTQSLYESSKFFISSSKADCIIRSRFELWVETSATSKPLSMLNQSCLVSELRADTLNVHEQTFQFISGL